MPNTTPNTQPSSQEDSFAKLLQLLQDDDNGREVNSAKNVQEKESMPVLEDISHPTDKEIPVDVEQKTALVSPVSISEEKKPENPKDLQKKKKKSGKLKKFFIIFFLLLLLFAGAVGAAGYYAYKEGMAMYAKVKTFETAARETYAALKSQNIPETKSKLQHVKTEFDGIKNQYATYSWASRIPFVNAYYGDGQHVMNAGEAGIQAAEIGLKSIEPYADVLGFAGEGTFAGGTAEDRVKVALETLDKIMPSIDELGGKLKTVETELAQISESRYPEEIKGIAVRSRITQAKELSVIGTEIMTEGKPVLEVLPKIAGADGKRKKYLVLFQNDKELRPTGGFMTAFSILYVENGKVYPEKSDDIYELDKKFAKKPEIPAVLKKFLTTEKRWNLRDMNIAPDTKDAMATFWENFQKVPGEPKDIDGIVLVDTHVLESIVKVIGPVEVPGYGTFTAENDKRCDCAQIIYALSEIVDRPTPYVRPDRKGIIGPMMQMILSKAYGSPKQLWPQLAQTAWENVQGKHVQFYFFDEKAQKAAETINAAGRVIETPEGSDYLYIVDANLGGAKSNLFVNSDVTEEVSAPENGVIKKTITLTYKNPFKASNCNLEAGELCLNGKLNNWQRIYLPKGAQITDSLGYDDGSTKTSEEYGKTVFEGVFSVTPMGQAKVKLTYTVPYTDTKNYKLYIQKQGGTEGIKHLMIVNGGEHEVVLDQDRKVSIPF